MSSLRLFAGLALPSSLHQRLALLQGGIPGARWTALENYHITLSFIGNVDDDITERADEALSAIRAECFAVTLKGAGHFAQGDHPQVLWIGVAENPALMRLQEKVHRALDGARVPIESRKYIPHVTLARFNHPDTRKLGEFLHAHGDFESAPFEVDSFVLYESRITKHGPVYDALKRYPLSFRR